ncbi:Phage terminase-like protein, large subunit [Acidipropionibacterium jensenii]|uniref:Phage terminase-like protein, large subunit n=1 Tax=Acidipropionibacterium jensenii TaxID=1749 RepID=A0A448NZV5_9ACTN|nr:terminase large subunit [Acidipropionibacterium jensenii]VEI03491.1 Phage terminase-like protein, large subunit [Acidipropionibacterium jensenii]
MLKPGAKSRIELPPLDTTGWPRGRAKRREKFIREFVLTPRGAGAHQRFRLRPWQREIVGGAFAPGVRTALWSLPRANGKTSLAAALAVAELFVGAASAEVLVVASDERQAGITVNLARRMIELNEELAGRVHIYKDRIEVPETDSVLRALPADPNALHGWDPSLLIVDELHTVTQEVWEAITSMSGKRPESLVLAISTPAASEDSIMWRLVKHGRDDDDPSFYLKEFAAPTGCDLWDRDAWAEANPALGDFLAADGMATAARTLREPAFRQLRLGQWVHSDVSWLPWGAWGKCVGGQRIVDGARVCLGFDGSSLSGKAAGDTTALVAATVEKVPHLEVLGCWDGSGPTPRAEVAEAVAGAFDRFDVVEMSADPWGWRSELEGWAGQYGDKKVVEFNTGYRKRMCPATDRFYQAVMNGGLTHDGDDRLAAHIDHATVIATPQGDMLTKPKKMSKLKIDLAIAAVIAFDRAQFHINHKARRGRVYSFKR